MPTIDCLFETKKVKNKKTHSKQAVRSVIYVAIYTEVQ